MSLKRKLVGFVGIGVLGVAVWALATGQMKVTFPNSPIASSEGTQIIAAPDGAPGATAINTDDKTRIEGIVRDYLLANPEILRDMANSLQAQEQAAQKERAKAALVDLKPKIFSSEFQTVMGNPEGDVTLVEFFDYNCGFCRRSFPELERLIKEDPKLRVVLKELPILSDESIQASRVAIAVHRRAPEKYSAFHRALLTSDGQVNGEAALKVAEGMGLKAKELIEAANTPETEAYIREGRELAQALGINGTPSYVIGDSLLPGAVGYGPLKEAVDNVRKCGKAQCS